MADESSAVAHRVVHLWVPMILTGVALQVAALGPQFGAVTSYIVGYLFGTAVTLFVTR